jgi:hypothetical protein
VTTLVARLATLVTKLVTSIEKGIHASQISVQQESHRDQRTVRPFHLRWWWVGLWRDTAGNFVAGGDAFPWYLVVACD